MITKNHRLINSTRVTLAVIFVGMLVLTYWTPRLYDDYRYYVETGGFSTIFADEFHQYMTWTGRSVAHVFLRFILRFPKLVFDIVNASGFTYLIYKMVSIARGHHKLSSIGTAGLLVWAFALLWMFTPTFAESFLWMSGAANYGLLMVIMLSFISIYHFNVVGNHELSLGVLGTVGLLILGVLAGWCNENTSGGTLLIVIGYILIAKFVQHQHIKAWMISGVVGNVIGLAFLVLAPGNARRATFFPKRNDLSLIWKLIDGMTRTFPSLNAHASILLVLATALLAYTIWQNGLGIQEMVSGLFFIGGLATILVLMIAPAGLYYSRSYFGGIFFIIVSLLISSVNLLDRQDSGTKLAMTLLVGYVGVNTFCLFFTGLSDIYQNYVSYNRQISSLVKQRDAGNQNPVVPGLRYQAQTPYAMTNMNSISKNVKDNVTTAGYWHVKTVRMK